MNEKDNDSGGNANDSKSEEFDDNEDDLVLSQAYDFYLTQMEQSVPKVDTLCTEFPSLTLDKDGDAATTSKIIASKINVTVLQHDDNQLNTSGKNAKRGPTSNLDVEIRATQQRKSGRNLSKQQKKTEEENVESEMERLFDSDFSDEDPTYKPEDLSLAPTLSDSDDSQLITLDELLNHDYITNQEKLRLARSKAIALVFGKKVNKVPDMNNNDSFQVAQSILNEIFKRFWKTVKPRARWRIKNPDSWNRNVAVKRRAEGLPYMTKKKCRSPKVPKQVDCSKCKFHCNDNFTDSNRMLLCRKYWNMDFICKKNFILTHVNVNPTKRVLQDRKRTTVRAYAKQCFFRIDDKKENVCQNFFCKTLCIAPSVITDAIKQRDRSGCYSKDSDPRGKHIPANKTPTEVVEDVKRHIESFPTMESHYVRKKLRRKYLDRALTLHKMYQEYLKQCHKNKIAPSKIVSEMTYRRIFSTEFNLGFYVPKKDQCVLCNKYNQADNEGKTKLEQEYKQHIQRKNVCNSEKQNDKERAEKENNFLTLTFDLQAILQIPSTDVGLLYYTRKLTVYNLTLYENKPPNEAYCFFWSEIHGKKGSSEIGSILLHYLTTCIPVHLSELSLFSDTCGGQNRNQYIAALLLWIMQNTEHLKVVEHKFLESGHSYMEVDSMHSAIETAQKNCDIYSMTDWANVFKRARSKKVYKDGDKKITKNCYHVKEFKHFEFFDLKKLADSVMLNRNKNIQGERVQWLKIKRMKYIKGDKNIYYNYDMSNDFMEIDVTNAATQTGPTSSTSFDHGYSTRKKTKQQIDAPTPKSTHRDFLSLQKLYLKPLPISVAKKKDLVTLCKKGVIPEEYHGWFNSLQTEDSCVDRLPDLTQSDSDPSESDSEAI